MSPETIHPYANAVIGEKQQRLWDPNQYLLSSDKIPNEVPIDGRYSLAEIKKHIDQTRSFGGFERREIIELTGYHADIMRPNGCGIVNLYMILDTLDPNFSQDYPNADALAVKALSYHLNDFRDGNNTTVNKGNPMFNPRAGWYHDGLAYVASQDANVDVFRVENMSGESQLANLANMCIKLQEQGKKVAVLASVHNGAWRGNPQLEETHLLTVSGFEVKNGKVSRMRISDSFPTNGVAIHNAFTSVNPEMFTGKFMVFASRE